MALSEGIKRGTFELMILTLLQDGDMYGYQITHELANRSHGMYSILEGSMYPTLYRLVNKRYLSDRHEKVGARRTWIYYHLEESGKAYLTELKKEYCGITLGIFNILGITDINELQPKIYAILPIV